MLVLYGSKYGTARRYAEEFARRAGTAAVSVKDRVPAAEGITVFFGALYMGRVYGLKRALKKAAGCSRLLVVTGGLTDPSAPAVAESRSGAVLAAIPQQLHKSVQVFHLRGAVDFARLSAGRRLLLKMLRSMAERTDPAQRTPEMRAVLETEGKSADYTDFAALDAVLRAAGLAGEAAQAE